MNSEDRVKILIVEDLEVNRLMLREILGELYEIEEAENGIEAISLLRNMRVKPDLILLDVVMPGMDGFQALERIKGNPLLAKIPVIFISANNEEERGLALGAVDYIIKPFEPEIVRLRVNTQAELFRYRERLEHMVQDKAEELITARETYLETMANLIEYRSVESGQHVKRTKDLSALLIRQLMRGGPYWDELAGCNYPSLIKAVPLHDIGKIAIPDSILLKPGKLTTEEFDVIKTHTTVGGQIIDSLMRNNKEDDYLIHCRDICLYHHERWDGAGYPSGISGIDIPLSARIVALVDIYDALVTERCYKPAYSHEEAMKILLESSGAHLDPVVVEAFLLIEDQFRDYEEHDYININLARQ